MLAGFVQRDPFSVLRLLSSVPERILFCRRRGSREGAPRQSSIRLPFLFFSRKWLVKLPRTAHIVSVAKRRKTMNERPEIVCATCGTDEKALYERGCQGDLSSTKKKKESLTHGAPRRPRRFLAIFPMEPQEFIVRRHGPCQCPRSAAWKVSTLCFSTPKERKAHDSDVPRGTA